MRVRKQRQEDTWETRRLAVWLLVCGQPLYLIALGQHPQSLSLCAFSLLEWWAVKETKQIKKKKSSVYTQNTASVRHTVMLATLCLTKLVAIYTWNSTKCAFEDKEHDTKVLLSLITLIFFCPPLINQAKCSISPLYFSEMWLEMAFAQDFGKHFGPRWSLITMRANAERTFLEEVFNTHARTRSIKKCISGN